MLQLSRLDENSELHNRFLTAVLKANGYPQRGRLDRTASQLTEDSFHVVGNDGDDYYVRVLKSDGETFVHCTCDAGIHDTPCYHAAYVMLRRGFVTTSAGASFVITSNLTKSDNIPLLSVDVPGGQTIKLGGVTLTYDEAVTLTVTRN